MQLLRMAMAENAGVEVSDASGVGQLSSRRGSRQVLDSWMFFHATWLWRMNCFQCLNRLSLSSAVQPQTNTMQSDQGFEPTTPEDAAHSAPQSTFSGDALARRRLLLKGLGKGASAAAVLVPIQTLAAPTPLDGVTRLCTVSGIQSNVGSGRTGGTTAQCRGYTPTYFRTLANWPGYVSSTQRATFQLRGTNYTQRSTFKAVFANTSASGDRLIDILTNSSPASELIWTTALLNAFKRNGGTGAGTDGYFPYSATEVVALYNNTAKRADAEYFFANYLQTLNS